MEKLASANAHFALDLFRKLREANPTGNIFYSPISISTAMAMVFLGSRENTATQLAKTFHFDDIEDVHSRFQTLNAEFNRREAPYILKVANRLYGEKTYNFLQDFLTSTQKLYGAELSVVDFQNAAGEARKQINQWVKEQTQGKILDLLPEGSLDEMTRLVLVNAIYFKGIWETPFPEENTSEKPFRLSKKEKKTVKMMYMVKELPFRYIPECRCRVLEVPYKGKELSMLILLPDDIEDDSTGLEQLEKELTLAKLQEWTEPGMMSYFNEVNVHLPKFKLEETYDLKSSLSALETTDIFVRGKANLSGMSGSPDLHVSKIVHKSFIEVNEEAECKCHVLELPYKGKELSILILLPDDIKDNSTGQEQLEKELTLAKLHERTEPGKMSFIDEICGYFSKFKLEETYDLKSSLSALGMVDVFDSGKANVWNVWVP